MAKAYRHKLVGNFLFYSFRSRGHEECRVRRVISITGGIAHHPTPGAHENHAHLAATKGAAEILLQSLAPDLARYGITCDAIAPGPIATGRPAPVQLPSTAIGRLGATEEIAYLCRVLCSPQASFVTGQVILADGGGMI